MYKINNDEIKILITDVDGTLFDGPYAPLNSKDQKVLDDFLSGGNYFSLNTGNALISMGGIWKKMVRKITDKTKYMVCLNGNLVKNIETNDSYVENNFTNDQVREFIIDCKSNGWSFNLNGENGSKYYFETEKSRIEWIKKTNFGKENFFVLNEENILDINISPKFTIYGLNEVQRVLAKDFFEKKYPEVVLTWFNDSGFDMSAGPVDKLIGINKVLELINKENKTNLNLNNVIYFGDHHNDVPAFRGCKYAIAMGNATDELKRLSFDVTDTVANGGVWRYLEKIKV